MWLGRETGHNLVRRGSPDPAESATAGLQRVSERNNPLPV